MTNQSDLQQSIRAITSTALNYEGDWHALFHSASIPIGTYNERLLAWINAQLSSSYTEINGAKAAYAESLGYANWNSLDRVASFTPASLGSKLLAWYDFGDAATITGSPSVTAVSDKSSNARNLTGTNNPQWDGLKITFDGSTNYLSRTSAFMYANGTCEIHAVMKSAGGSNKSLVGEGSSSSTNPIYQTILTNQTNANDDVYAFIRNDALTTTFANSLSTGAVAFDDVKKLVSFIDSGSEITCLINGVEGSSPQIYTRSGVLTLNRFAIGALLRATAGNFYAGDAWEIVITGLLDDAERNQLMQYLGTKHGL